MHDYGKLSWCRRYALARILTQLRAYFSILYMMNFTAVYDQISKVRVRRIDVLRKGFASTCIAYRFENWNGWYRNNVEENKWGKIDNTVAETKRFPIWGKRVFAGDVCCLEGLCKTYHCVTTAATTFYSGYHYLHCLQWVQLYTLFTVGTTVYSMYN